MTTGADLYRLQCLDSEGDAKRRRLAEIEAALVESEALKQARGALKGARSLIQRWALRQRDLELEIQGLSNKIARSEQRLYSGVVKNPKELADLQAEVAALKRRRQKLEDDLLEAMIEREEAETAHSQAQAHLDEIQTRWSAPEGRTRDAAGTAGRNRAGASSTAAQHRGRRPGRLPGPATQERRTGRSPGAQWGM